MGFRIKTKYFLNDGSSIPQFEFNSSDDPYVKNRTFREAINLKKFKRMTLGIKRMGLKIKDL